MMAVLSKNFQESQPKRAAYTRRLFTVFVVFVYYKYTKKKRDTQIYFRLRISYSRLQIKTNVSVYFSSSECLFLLYVVDFGINFVASS